MAARGALRTRLREHGTHPDAPRRPPGKSGLTFKPQLAKLVRAGRKTETRRIDTGQSYRLKPGDDVAVQPGRGKPALCRVTIQTVDRQVLGDLDDRAARAEGFDSREEFFAYWRDLHGYALPAEQLALLERLAVSDPLPARVLHPGATDAAVGARLRALEKRGYATATGDGAAGRWQITDAGADYLDDPSTAVDLTVPVWVIRFKLADRVDEQPMLMAANGGDWDREGRGYTSVQAHATGGVPVTLPDGREVTMPEPETIPHGLPKPRWRQDSERDRTEALLSDLEARLARLRVEAAEKDVDITPLLRTLSAKVERGERMVDREGRRAA